RASATFCAIAPRRRASRPWISLKFALHSRPPVPKLRHFKARRLGPAAPISLSEHAIGAKKPQKAKCHHRRHTETRSGVMGRQEESPAAQPRQRDRKSVV